MNGDDKNKLTAFDSINMISNDFSKILIEDTKERFEQINDNSSNSHLSIIDQITSWDAFTTDIVAKVCHQVATKQMMPKKAIEIFIKNGIIDRDVPKQNTIFGNISENSLNADEYNWNSDVAKDFYGLLNIINKHSPYMGWKRNEKIFDTDYNHFWDFTKPHDEQSDFTLGGGSGEQDRSSINDWAEFQATIFEGREFPIFMYSVVPFNIADEQSKVSQFFSSMTEGVSYQKRMTSDYFSLTGRGQTFLNPNKVPQDDYWWSQPIKWKKDKSFFDPSDNILGGVIDVMLLLGSRGRNLKNPSFMAKWGHRLKTYASRIGVGTAVGSTGVSYLGHEQKTMKQAFDEKWGPFAPFGDAWRHGNMREEIKEVY
jgi:hypothetical protein